VPGWLWCPTTAALPCLRFVPGGTYHMGAQATQPDAPAHDLDASADEAPVHVVTISALYVMRTEVNAHAYMRCVGAGACRLEDVLTVGGYFNYGQPHRGSHPINGVNWFGARRFCEWLGGRLPTEAEWEFLARGSDERRFPWGEEPPDCVDGRSAGLHQGCPSDGTRPPGIRTTATAAGLVAMGGGVWEWVSDWYGSYESRPLHDPVGPATGTRRVQRGGAWSSEGPLERRGSHRASMPPDSRLSDVGFRCVRDAN